MALEIVLTEWALQSYLRLCVAILGNVAYLCQAFVKSNDSQDKREAAKLDMRISHIRAGRFDFRGKL